ncbi:MAG: polysaccharide deacetylase family protein [Archangiaceae bacterium]|nr:polysaccharide deacetylase family protein [Archangiaceae bacterium]
MIPEALALGATAASGVISLGVFHPRVALFGPVVWHGRRDSKRVALSFDDGPHPQFTVQVAEALAKANAKATFFCVGQFVEAHPEVAKQLLAEGHELANHTFTHGMGAHLFVQAKLQADLERCQRTLATLVTEPPRLYRPAVGIRNPVVHRAAKALGLTVVTWADAARDGAFPFTERRAVELGQRARPGDILALHDGALHGGQVFRRESTVRHLPKLLAVLRDRGFEMSTVTQVL